MADFLAICASSNEDDDRVVIVRACDVAGAVERVIKLTGTCPDRIFYHVGMREIDLNGHHTTNGASAHRSAA